jgi:hypothetical protein
MFLTSAFIRIYFSICSENLGMLDDEGVANWIDPLELKHRVKDSRIFNIDPFSLYGTPDFDFTYFDDDDLTFHEYEADWISNEKCF